jgi:hypothetical protein
MAREELAIEAGVDLAAFDAAAAPFEKKVGPWLKKTPDAFAFCAGTLTKAAARSRYRRRMTSKKTRSS